MRRLALISVVVAIAAVAAGSGAAQQAASPCATIDLPTWSPDGQQIAYVGTRTGRRTHPILRAICVANPDGTNAAPLPNTTCTRRQCPLDLIDSPTQLFWVRPNLLLYGDDFRIFKIPVGGKPQPLGHQPGSLEQFSVDAGGDRVAAGFTDCAQCAGPVTTLGVPSGQRVGKLGGAKLDNVEASISPDGTRVVFERHYTDSHSNPALGIWTARADGSHLRRLERVGEAPLWSPAGDKIAYVGKPPRFSTLLLLSPGGGRSTTLVAHGVRAVFGWSPDGKKLAYEDSKNRLRVVDVQTRAVRNLLQLHFAPSAAWSPDSQQLLVNMWPKRHGCFYDMWRVPVDGSKPQLLRHC
jgi:WD40-like Beta Propeller Repeat